MRDEPARTPFPAATQRDALSRGLDAALLRVADRAPRWSVAAAVAGALAAALLAMAPAAHAQGLYKWVDANGRITYSDQPPPPTVKVEKVIPRAPEGDAEAARELARRDAEFRKRQQAQAEKSAKATEQAGAEAQRREVCTQLTGQLTALRSGGLAARYNEKGERVVLDPEQTKREIAEIEQLIAQRCQ